MHVNIFEALSLPGKKLTILYYEALRQRALDLINISKSWSASNHNVEIDEALHIHGHYTEGFYDEQLDKLFMDLGKK